MVQVRFHDGWDDPIVITTIIGGIILVALFIWRQSHLETPLLNFGVFKINNLL